MPGKRKHRQLRERLERERDAAIDQLRQLGISPETDRTTPRAGADHPLDEGDQAQASERDDLNFMTRERLAERINRLTGALERMGEGTYGICEICGRPIEPSRLEALPEAVTCLECQQRQERAA
jgi:DnaK suppressor protein